jgi:Fe-S-cluster containining protein
MNIREFCENLQNIYDEMWRTFSEYQKASGLHCLEGCGKCCNNPEVEASVMEMLPLALRMHDEGKLEYWIDQLEMTEQEHCLMYRPHSPDGSKGQCGVYNERPSLCRMFGVSGFYNKHREVTLSVCKLIKDKYPELLTQREKEVSEEKTPMLITWSYRLAQLDPALIQDRLPINQAFKKALEKIALYAQYQDIP